MKPDRPLRAPSAICVIAQQYSSSTFATLRSLPPCKEILGARLKMLLFQAFLKMELSLKLRRFKVSKLGSFKMNHELNDVIKTQI
jgi:hypothetical protein